MTRPPRPHPGHRRPYRVEGTGGEVDGPADRRRRQLGLGRFFDGDHQARGVEGIRGEGQQPVVGEQHRSSRRVLVEGGRDAANRDVGSPRTPRHDRDRLCLAEAQQRLGPTWQLAVREREGGGGRRVGVDDPAHVIPGLVDNRVHRDDLGVLGTERTFEHLAAEVHRRQLVGAQTADHAGGGEREPLSVEPDAQVGMPGVRHDSGVEEMVHGCHHEVAGSGLLRRHASLQGFGSSLTASVDTATNIPRALWRLCGVSVVLMGVTSLGGRQIRHIDLAGIS